MGYISQGLQCYNLHVPAIHLVAAQVVPTSLIHYITKYRNSPGAETIVVSSLSTALSSVYEPCFSFHFSYSSLPPLSPHFFITMTDHTFPKHSLKAW